MKRHFLVAQLTIFAHGEGRFWWSKVRGEETECATREASVAFWRESSALLDGETTTTTEVASVENQPEAAVAVMRGNTLDPSTRASARVLGASTSLKRASARLLALYLLHEIFRSSPRCTYSIAVSP